MKVVFSKLIFLIEIRLMGMFGLVFRMKFSGLRAMVFILRALLLSFLFVKHCYADLADIDKFCRNASNVFKEIKIEEKGFRNLGVACYGFGENIKLRNSIAVPKGEEKRVKSKLYSDYIKSRYCVIDKAHELFKVIPFVVTYYSFEGAFLEEVMIDKIPCEHYLSKRQK